MSKLAIETLYGSVIEYARESLKKDIDDAWEFFWEEDEPEDMMGGGALEVGFINFEDWFICDYKTESGSTIQKYIDATSPDKEIIDALKVLENSYLSLYEVKESGEKIVLKDLAIGGEIEIVERRLEGLSEGDFFATRIVELEGKNVIGRCVYPFGAQMRADVLNMLDGQFQRYTKNKKPGASMLEFLKEETYAFNIIWANSLMRPSSN